MQLHDLSAEEVACIGDSEVDLSMHVKGSTFIGFNPTRESSSDAFAEAGVPVVESSDLRDIWVYLFGQPFEAKASSH